MKRLNFRGIERPFDSSWVWRQIIKIKNLVKHHIEYVLGDGKSFSFWYDHLIQEKSLIDQYPEINIQDTDVPKNAKVADLWRDNNWSLPDPIDDITERAWAFLNNNCKVFPVNTDIVKHSFLTWLVIMGRINTKDKLLRWGVIQSNTCSLYSQHNILRVSNDIRPVNCLRRDVRFLTRRANGRSGKVKARRLWFNAYIYDIWFARNDMIFNQNRHNIMQVCNTIISNVRNSCSSISEELLLLVGGADLLTGLVPFSLGKLKKFQALVFMNC
ncbi:uncharacterized protein LOC126657119 [Mercurialis annua]|uniref:uncharacterized protein LOC126657119 n=1 Tax=Mercurialis annua TaxID=3986 RepID=UPI00215E0DE8|nr:uncharacterized protein LOC126657119 [Mercurialis annua]